MLVVLHLNVLCFWEIRTFTSLFINHFIRLIKIYSCMTTHLCIRSIPLSNFVALRMGQASSWWRNSLSSSLVKLVIEQLALTSSTLSQSIWHLRLLSNSLKLLVLRLTSKFLRFDRLISPIFQASYCVSLVLFRHVIRLRTWLLRYRHALFQEGFIIVGLVKLLCVRSLSHAQTRLKTFLLACSRMRFHAIRNNRLLIIRFKCGDSVAAIIHVRDVLQVIYYILVFSHRRFTPYLLRLISIYKNS